MPIDELMKRSRDAAQRAREMLAAAKVMDESAGPAERRRIAAAGPLREIQAYADAVQRLRDIDEKLDDRQRRLQSLRRDTERLPEVRRRQTASLEAEIADLKAARRDLEDEVGATLLPVQPQPAPRLAQHPVEEIEDPAMVESHPSPTISPSHLPERVGTIRSADNLASAPGQAAGSRSSQPAHSDGGKAIDGGDDKIVKSKTTSSVPNANSLDTWIAGLPPVPHTAAGAVDVDALRTGQVYRMPESAGGGLGRWTNGLFHNYDEKTDWDFRSVADLDAYSGASGQPTPEDRQDLRIRWLKSGGDFMPAVYPEAPDIDRFNSEDNDGVRAAQGDDVVSFRLRDGPAFLTLPDDAAAVLVRNWDDFRPRVTLLSRLFAYDLPPEEMRRLVEAEVYKGIPESERSKFLAMRQDGTTYDFEGPYGAQKHLAGMRMRAFDEMVDGIRRGTTDEELAQLIRDFQEIMLPELMGAGRFLKEFVKDMVPGLNNLRSGFHFWNDLIELKEEWKEGDIAGLAGNGALLLLDTLGLFPIVGSAFAPVRTALKKGAGAIGRAAPRLDGLVAQAQLWRHQLQGPNLTRKIDASRIFGEALTDLPENIQRPVRSTINFLFGHVGEGYQHGLLARMDPATHGHTRVNIPVHLQPMLGGGRARTYDGLARRATDILVQDIVEWVGRLTGRRWEGIQARLKHYEFKTGAGRKRLQDLIDAVANDNPGLLTDTLGNAVNNVQRARIYTEQIPMELAIAHAEMRFGRLVANHVIDATTSRKLLDAMRNSYKRGTKLIGLFDYVGL
ncbi:MAG: hypothetical protein OEN55_15615, partial [Alphaproteobacteria bacterium]|nr:hypothetical protein [Alphaproteobacteria bacterium]